MLLVSFCFILTWVHQICKKEFLVLLNVSHGLLEAETERKYTPVSTIGVDYCVVIVFCTKCYGVDGINVSAGRPGMRTWR